VKWGEGLSNRVSIIIRRYIDHMKFVVLWLFLSSNSFIFFWFYFVYCIYVCMYVCMFCTPLFNFVNYVFLLLCMLIVMCMYSYCYYVPFWVFCFIVLFCVLFVCKCVLYYCHRVSPQLQLNIYQYLRLTAGKETWSMKSTGQEDVHIVGIHVVTKIPCSYPIRPLLGVRG
jgi:hypothetical protein